MIEKKGARVAVCKLCVRKGGRDICEGFLLDYSEKGTTDHFRERSLTEN